MLGNNNDQPKRKIYLNIKNGKIVRRTEEGKEQYFDYVQGSLSNIFQKQRTFRGENVVYWYIDLRDESGELYSLGFPYSSNTFKSIILSLASANEFRSITIQPYTSNGYDKVVCYSGTLKLDWATKKLPPIETVHIGGRTIKDDSKRMAFISSLVKNIINNLVESLRTR